MLTKIDIFEISADDGLEVLLKEKTERNGIYIYKFSLSWTEANAGKNSQFLFSWFTPMIDIMYRWNTALKNDRHLSRNYDPYTDSMISKNAPVDAFYDGKGFNRYTWALDEAKQLVQFRSGADESKGELNCMFKLGVRQFTKKSETELTIRIDTRYIPLFDAVSDVAKWWEEDCGMKALDVPFYAKEPLYSFWYSFHGGISAEKVEDECRRAKEFGFDVAIIDDGWQKDPGVPGYVNCGDWIPSEIKMKDMAAHVERVHQIGMKYILWFTFPYIGYKSKAFERFKNMLLREPDLTKVNNADYAPPIIDPRYKEVREYLINIIVGALKDWKLDGFKLDFIDRWCDDPANAPYNEKMDIPALQDAVDTFMTELVGTLVRIKPDILIEFRQFYIGPNMRKFGNMFRVNDCPNDHMSNRVGVLDLRMLMRSSAVHSDMLMWHDDENPETAALQIISVMFGVLQYSSKLENMSEGIKKMSSFWLGYLKKHRKLLLDSPLEVYEPHMLYTWVKAKGEDENLITVYGVDKCVKCDNVAKIHIVNGAMSNRILFELEGKYNIKILDCYGETVREEKGKAFCGINTLEVPVGGVLEFEILMC